MESANKDEAVMDAIHLTPRELYILLTSVENKLSLRLDLEEKARELQAIETNAAYIC